MTTNNLIKKYECNTNKSSYPKFSPTIYNLNISNIVAAGKTIIHIIGDNFFPESFGITTLNFGRYKNIPFIFYDSFNISFVVPSDADSGIYDIVAVNLYNGNFGPNINQMYTGRNIYSNVVQHLIK